MDTTALRRLQEDYLEHGYALLEGALEPAVVAGLRDAVKRLRDAHDPETDREIFRTDDRDAGRDEAFFASAYGVRGFLEADALGAEGRLAVPHEHCLNKIGHALHDRVDEFRELARSELVREAFLVGGLTSGRLVQSMVIFKQPRIGAEVRWHQDASYLRSEPQRVVGLWFALEDAHRGNGCLEVAPGAHRGPLRERYVVDWTRREGELVSIDDTPWPEKGITLEVPAGSLVVFHDHLPHRSGPNTSSSSRVALTLHAHDAAARWSDDNWLQRGELEDFVIGG